MESYAWKWNGLKDSVWLFKMEEISASEARKTEIVNYEFLKNLESKFLVKIWLILYCKIVKIWTHEEV